MECIDCKYKDDCKIYKEEHVKKYPLPKINTKDLSIFG